MSEIKTHLSVVGWCRRQAPAQDDMGDSHAALSDGNRSPALDVLETCGRSQQQQRQRIHRFRSDPPDQSYNNAPADTQLSSPDTAHLSSFCVACKAGAALKCSLSRPLSSRVPMEP